MNAPLAIIRSQDDLVEAMRARKDELGLSNQFCDEVGGLSSGHTDKVIGPSRTKPMSRMMMDLMLEMLAMELHAYPNLEAAQRMESRWQGRETRNVRPDGVKVSKKLLARAKPLVLKDLSALGVAARKDMLTGEHRSRIARKAARARWRKRRKERERK